MVDAAVIFHHDLGPYGTWILTYAKGLDRNNSYVEKLCEAYQAYYDSRSPENIDKLKSRIDDICEVFMMEKPK